MADSYETQQPDFEAFVGLAALRRVRMIVDGPKGFAYIKSLVGPPQPYAMQNHLGAVFLPQLSTDSHNLLVARVKRGSPAARAGIFTGDQLLEYDKIDARNWRTQVKVDFPLVDFTDPAGTLHTFLLQRGQTTFRVTVKLEDILGP
jgi:hypothetical protein